MKYRCVSNRMLANNVVFGAWIHRGSMRETVIKRSDVPPYQSVSYTLYAGPLALEIA